ncbi:hypothetical protein ABZP36_024218 [Zizania latifolia]
MCKVLGTVQSWTQLSFFSQNCVLRKEGMDSNRDILIHIVHSSRIRFLSLEHAWFFLYRSSTTNPGSRQLFFRANQSVVVSEGCHCQWWSPISPISSFFFINPC